MTVESRPGVGLTQVSVGYKDGVFDQTRRFIESRRLAFNSQVVRFAKVTGVSENCQSGALRSRDFLVVDPAKISKLAKAGNEDLRDTLSRELLKLLGFFENSAVISHRMRDEAGNKILEFDHPTLPYKAETLVHNVGRKQYLISGFVISPK